MTHGGREEGGRNITQSLARSSPCWWVGFITEEHFRLYAILFWRSRTPTSSKLVTPPFPSPHHWRGSTPLPLFCQNLPPHHPNPTPPPSPVYSYFPSPEPICSVWESPRSPSSFLQPRVWGWCQSLPVMCLWPQKALVSVLPTSFLTLSSSPSASFFSPPQRNPCPLIFSRLIAKPGRLRETTRRPLHLPAGGGDGGR